jgi:hypothetical protein
MITTSTNSPALTFSTFSLSEIKQVEDEIEVSEF